MVTIVQAIPDGTGIRARRTRSGVRIETAEDYPAWLPELVRDITSAAMTDRVDGILSGNRFWITGLPNMRTNQVHVIRWLSRCIRQMPLQAALPLRIECYNEQDMARAIDSMMSAGYNQFMFFHMEEP